MTEFRKLRSLISNIHSEVTSLFIRVPIHDCITINIDFVLRGITFSEMLPPAKICLTSNYFSFQGKFYQQTSGPPMGYPLFSVVADVVMEAFETDAMKSSCYKLKVWL